MDVFADPRVESVARGSLVPNPRNARMHTEKQIQQIAASIERFGFLAPIIVDADNRIAAGHGRWRAAKLLKLDRVPVIRREFVTDADFTAFSLADNRIAELSEWDQPALDAQLKDLFSAGYNFEVTGFTSKDLTFSVDAPPVSDEAEAVELPDPNDVAVSRLGDLWHIGPHRLFCGDARAAVSYEALLGDERAAMIFSDPPYGVRVKGHITKKAHHREFAMMSGEQSPAELIAFFRAVFRNCVRFSQGGSIHYQCIDWRHFREMLDAGDGIYTEFKQLIVWMKDAGALGTFYRSQHELILVFKSGRSRHINNFGLGETGRYRTNVWSYPGCNTFSKGRAADLKAHPTVKPTALVVDAIRDCSNPGDLILDPFSGSGTTLLSAHLAGRRGAAIELDPLYVDTALRRLVTATGLDARLPDGRTFDQVATDRSQEGGRG